MARALRRRGLRAALTVAALGTATLMAASTAALAATNTPSQTPGACAPNAHAPRVGRFGGIVSAVNAQTGCQALNGQALNTNSQAAGDTANGTPPLIWHGGAVMGTKLTGPLVITPIFWHPAGHPMTAAYKNIITTYLSNVAQASGRTNNVYSTATEYSGTDGKIRYQIRLGTPINDTGTLPADGCTLASTDTTGIYADSSGYNACLDDNQVIAETDRVVTAKGLPQNFAHIYVLYLPKHVESCFFPGPTDTSANACTINYQPSAAYCAYHSQAPSSTIYANLAYPIYRRRRGSPAVATPKFPVDPSAERESRRRHRDQPHEPRDNGGDGPTRTP